MISILTPVENVHDGKYIRSYLLNMLLFVVGVVVVVAVYIHRIVKWPL